MTLQGICQRPMTQRTAVEIGAQGKDQADVGTAARRRIGEACQQHVDETMKDRLVFDQGEGFLELIGDQQVRVPLLRLRQSAKTSRKVSSPVCRLAANCLVLRKRSVSDWLAT